MDTRLLMQVADELHRLRNEKRYAELLEHRKFIIQLAREMRYSERVTRRRIVRNFTRKQTAIGERILSELAQTQPITWRGTKL